MDSETSTTRKSNTAKIRRREIKYKRISTSSVCGKDGIPTSCATIRGTATKKTQKEVGPSFMILLSQPPSLWKRDLCIKNHGFLEHRASLQKSQKQPDDLKAPCQKSGRTPCPPLRWKSSVSVERRSSLPPLLGQVPQRGNLCEPFGQQGTIDNMQGSTQQPNNEPARISRNTRTSGRNHARVLRHAPCTKTNAQGSSESSNISRMRDFESDLDRDGTRAHPLNPPPPTLPTIYIQSILTSFPSSRAMPARQQYHHATARTVSWITTITTTPPTDKATTRLRLSRDGC